MKYFLLAVLCASFSQASGQCLLINEIMINGGTAFDGSNMPNTEEWVEFYNSCPTPIDISCYVLTDGDFIVNIPNGTTIPGNSYFTIGSSNSGFPVDLNWATCNCTTNTATQVGIFGNNAEQIVLNDDSGNFAGGIYWGSGAFPININGAASGGCPAQDVFYSGPTNIFEALPASGGQGCSISRLCNGEWAETCAPDVTPGESNGSVNATVNFQASQNIICAGDCVDFEDLSTGATSWNWTFTGASIASSTDQNPTTVCYANSGVFGVQLQITSACGPASIYFPDIITVNEAEVPVIDSSGSLTFCEGGQVILSCAQTGSLQWYQDGIAIAGATSNTYTATESGIYTVNLTNANCQNLSAGVVVTMNPGIAVPVDPAGPIDLCEGESTTLSTAGSYASYQWQLDGTDIPAATSNSIDVSESGDYSLLVTSTLCSAESNVVSVNVTPTPVVHITPTGTTDGCEGTPVTIQTSDVFDTYQWTLNGIAISNAIAPHIDATESGTYNLIVTDNSCPGSSDDVDLIFHPIATVAIVPNADVTTCESSTVLEAQTDGDVQWFLNGNPMPGEDNLILLATNDGAYSFSSSLNGFCPVTSDIVDVLLNVPIFITLQASADSACVGDIITINAQGNFQNINWNISQTSTSIEVATSGDYIATATSGTCSVMDTVSVVFNEYPLVNAGDNIQSDCADLTQLFGDSEGIAHWEVDGFSVGSGDTLTITSPKKTTDYVLVSELNLCVSRDTMTVTVDCVFLYVPNTFTPDNDGINDVFRVYAKGIPKYYFRIYNRWGQLVFETDDTEKVWTGGAPDYYLPDGVYVWQVVALDYNNVPVLDEKNSTGTITIIR